MGIPNNLTIIIISVSIALVVAIFFVILGFYLRKNEHQESLNDEIDAIIKEVDHPNKKKVSLIDQWNNFWKKLLNSGGFKRYSVDENHPGRDVLILSILLISIFSFVFKNVFAGLFITIMVLAFSIYYFKNRSNKKTLLITSQLSGFIFSIKANTQGRRTLDQALIKVADQMPNPLKSELTISKKQLLAGVSFSAVMEDLAARTSSPDLKFLAISMIQAYETGGSIENQLNIFQEVIESKREYSDLVNKKTVELKQSVYIAMGLIPGSFLLFYFLMPSFQEFYFKSLISWVVFLVIAAIYTLGMLFSRMLINQIENFNKG